MTIWEFSVVLQHLNLRYLACCRTSHSDIQAISLLKLPLLALSKYVNAKIQERNPQQLAISFYLSLVLLHQLFVYVSFSLALELFLPLITTVIFLAPLHLPLSINSLIPSTRQRVIHRSLFLHLQVTQRSFSQLPLIVVSALLSTLELFFFVLF